MRDIAQANCLGGSIESTGYVQSALAMFADRQRTREAADAGVHAELGVQAEVLQERLYVLRVQRLAAEAQQALPRRLLHVDLVEQLREAQLSQPAQKVRAIAWF